MGRIDKTKANVVNDAIAAIYVDHFGGEKVINANARLLMAAPDLLRALENIVERIECLEAEGHRLQINLEMSSAKQAITKATGDEVKTPLPEGKGES